MGEDQVQLFSSVLAVVALCGSLGVWGLKLAARWSVQARAVLGAVGDAALWLAATVAVSATAGSLYFSEVAGYVPCKLCWWQRIAMFPLAVVLSVAAARRDRGVRFHVIPVALAGLSVSVYHYLIEWFPSIEKTSCSLDVPCTAVWFRGFGFASLAFMAGCGFFAIVTLLACRPGSERSDEQAGS
jgi:disulfide bond formation protein DsbB